MKKILFLFCIGVVFISSHTRAQQTYSISGTVNDEKEQPVPGATVFLTNTKKITSAGPDGKFILNGITPGSYKMVVKMLGFKQYIQNIKLQDKAITLNVRLDEAMIDLNAVTINGTPPRDQKKYLALFIKYFFGRTSYASQCKIVNPEVLKFHYTQRMGGDLFEAGADDFIIIENKALGYKLKYLLTQFKVDYKKNIYNVTGYPYFEELNGNTDQQKKWDENRLSAYLGSERHFFRAVLKGSTTREGFYIYQSPVSVPLYNYLYGDKEFVPANWAHDPILTDTLFKPYKNYRVLITKGKPGKRDTLRPVFFIIYTGRPVAHPIDYQNQISVMCPIVDTLIIDKNSVITPESTPVINGYWADGQAATLLPLEYSVAPLQTKRPVIKQTDIKK